MARRIDFIFLSYQFQPGYDKGCKFGNYSADLYDIYLRIIVLCLFIMLGSHAQSVINKLKVAKLKLNESEELVRYKELFDNVAEGVFLFNPKGRFIESNDRILESTG
jgi:PAS domain-containing protein